MSGARPGRPTNDRVHLHVRVNPATRAYLESRAVGALGNLGRAVDAAVAAWRSVPLEPRVCPVCVAVRGLKRIDAALADLAPVPDSASYARAVGAAQGTLMSITDPSAALGLCEEHLSGAPSPPDPNKEAF